MSVPGPAAERRATRRDAPSVPADFVGVWRRRDLHVGGELRDDADVLWLQAGSWYADLRVPHDDPGGPVEAFAGPAAWRPPHFTWFHDLDWCGSFPDDVGHLEAAGDDLIERGTFLIDGDDVPYEERWVRSSPPGPRLVARCDDATGRACVVRVADQAIGLADARLHGGGFAAWRVERVDGEWRSVFRRSIDEAPFPRIPLDHPWRVGDRVEAGRWTLTVCEATVATEPEGDFEGA